MAMALSALTTDRLARSVTHQPEPNVTHQVELGNDGTRLLDRSDSRIGGFPFGEDGGPTSLAWRRPGDNWLAGVAREVGRAVSFRLAVIGFEASGSVRAEAMTDGPPHDRGYGLLLSAQAVYLGPAMRSPARKRASLHAHAGPALCRRR